MGFRDDSSAHHARAEALDRELAETREALREAERARGAAEHDRDALNARVTELEQSLARFRPTTSGDGADAAKPVADAAAAPAKRAAQIARDENRKRLAAAAGAVVVAFFAGGLALRSCGGEPKHSNVSSEPRSSTSTSSASASSSTPRELPPGVPAPPRIEHVSGEDWAHEPGKRHSIRYYINLTRQSRDPQARLVATVVCPHEGRQHVESVEVALPDPPIEVGQTANTFIDVFYRSKLNAHPARCELTFLWRHGETDVEVGRFCGVGPGEAKPSLPGACL